MSTNKGYERSSERGKGGKGEHYSGNGDLGQLKTLKVATISPRFRTLGPLEILLVIITRIIKKGQVGNEGISAVTTQGLTRTSW